MISDEEGLVEFLIKIFDEMLPADGRYLKRKPLQLHCHVVDLFYWLRPINEVLNFVRNLKSSVELLPVHRQFHIVGKNSLETNSYNLFGSDRHVLKGMSQETLLDELLNESRVHVEVDCGIVPWEIDVEFPENLLLYRYGVE